MLKRLSAFAVALLVIICSSFNCAAVELDGIPHNSEWVDSEIYSFENPDGFNNKVTFAYLRFIPADSANQLLLCVSMRVSELTDAESSAVLLTLNNGEEIRLNGDGKSPYDTDLYNIEYAMSYDEGAANIVYEIMLGVKLGIPSESTLTVRLCDCDGVPSNAFGFDLDVSDDIKEVSKQGKITKNYTDKTAASKVKSNKTKADSFTFNRVEVEEETQPVTKNDTTTQTVNLTQKAVDNNSVKKKVLATVGAVCALAVATCAVYISIKKSNKKEDNK